MAGIQNTLSVIHGVRGLVVDGSKLLKGGELTTLMNDFSEVASEFSAIVKGGIWANLGKLGKFVANPKVIKLVTDGKVVKVINDGKKIVGDANDVLKLLPEVGPELKDLDGDEASLVISEVYQAGLDCYDALVPAYKPAPLPKASAPADEEIV